MWRDGAKGFYAAASAAVIDIPPVVDEKIIQEFAPADAANSNPYLRSTESVSGYYIHKTNVPICHVKDFIMRDINFKIINFIIDTHNCICGHK